MQSLSMVDMPMCRAGQWWICSCAVVVNVGYGMCSGGQCWIYFCTVMVNVGYAHVQWWSMVDMLMCRSGQCSCSCSFMCSGGLSSMVVMLMFSSGQ